MSWIIPALIAVITLSVGTLLERILMKHDASDSIAYATVFQFILGIVSLLLSLLFGKFSLPHNLSVIPNFIVASFLWAGSTVFSFQAMKRLGAGEVTILGSTGTISTMLMSVFLLHEYVSLKVIIGMILILTSTILVISQKISFKSKSGILYAILSALCASIAVINDTVILKTYEAFSYMTVMSFLPAIVLFALYPRKVAQNQHLFKQKYLMLLSIFALVYSIQGISWYVALEYGAPMSQLSPLIKTSTVLTVIFAAVFLGERSHILKKSVAAVITTIGAILVG